jgi:hypothetical protein
MTLSWIIRRNRVSFEPPRVDLIFHCWSASERRIRKINPTQPEIVVTVHDPQYLHAGLAGTVRLQPAERQSGLKITSAANRIATSLRLPVPGVREG